MFDSVLGRGLGAPGRPGFGAAVSVALHAFLLAVALVISHPAQQPLPLPPIHFPTVHLGPQTPAGAKAPAAPRRPPVLKPRTTQVVAQPLPTPRMDDSPAQPEGPAQPGTGTGQGPVDDVPCQGAGCSTDGHPGGDGPVLFLGAEMVPPRLLSGPVPNYPAEAAFERLGGTVLLRCAVTASGTVEACTVLKGAPLLDEAALHAVTARRYAPALYEGRPVSVWMVLPVRFVPP